MICIALHRDGEGNQQTEGFLQELPKVLRLKSPEQRRVRQGWRVKEVRGGQRGTICETKRSNRQQSFIHCNAARHRNCISLSNP